MVQQCNTLYPGQLVTYYLVQEDVPICRWPLPTLRIVFIKKLLMISVGIAIKMLNTEFLSLLRCNVFKHWSAIACAPYTLGHTLIDAILRSRIAKGVAPTSY